MPVEFLSESQREHYGQFVGELSVVELARHCHLDDKDRALIKSRRGDHNRLGFAVQLCTVRCLGAFLVDPTDVPNNMVEFIARQVGECDPQCLPQYPDRKQTKYTHQAEIQCTYGYRDFNKAPWRFRLSRLLYAQAWTSTERPSQQFDIAIHWLMVNKVLLPGFSTLERLVSQIRERAANRLWGKLSSLPNQSQVAALEALLQVEAGAHTTALDRLRQAPVQVSGPAFLTALDRYVELRTLGMHRLNITGIPLVRLKVLARYAAKISAYRTARMPDNRRLASLVAFAHSYETQALDDALDVLDLLVSDITSRAKNLGKRNRLRTLKDLDKAALALARACALILDEGQTPDDLRASIFSLIAKPQLEQAIGTVNEIARPSEGVFHEEMVEQYGRLKRVVPRLLAAIQFKATASGVPVLQALAFLQTIDGPQKAMPSHAPVAFVTKAWRRLVFEKGGDISRAGYTLCLMDRLQDALRRRDIYVEDSDRWGDHRSKLLQGAEWEANKVQIYRSLGHPINVDEAIAGLSKQLDTAYQQTIQRFDQNTAVRIECANGKPSLTLTALAKLDESESLLALHDKVTALMPSIDLTELLLEVHAHTGFLDAFSHISEANARASDMPTSICAVLLAEACNIGREPFIRPATPELTRHRLLWAHQNYIRTETLIEANARLVNHQSKIPLAKYFGGGEVASADGMRFVTSGKTIHSGANRKYFGSGRGITWYNFLSDQYAGFHGIVVPGTLRDSIFVLEGLLEQQTSLTPREIMTDTAGASDMIFGLFWLLGYQFSPRLADAGEATLWRIDRKADYGVLNELVRNCIKPQRIEGQWDEILRVAGSLKLGAVSASELIRSLLKSDRPSALAQAIIEVGRINKTLYLLNYIDNEDYRRRILTQLNRGESRHAVARAICYGKRGEIQQSYREGQEDQLGALGLVTNAVVLWNTIYMNAAINQLREQGEEINEADLARLSPLINKHINMLGHYLFALAKGVRSGVLRPLNEPNTEPFGP